MWFRQPYEKKVDVMRKEDKENNGFSLIELIVVITIIAILTSILTPMLLRYVAQSRATACASNRTAFLRYYSIYEIEAGTNSTVPAFLSAAKLDGLPSDNICPGGGECTFEIVDGRLLVLCDMHYGSVDRPGNVPHPAGSMNNVFVLDPISGKYVEINVHDTGIGQKSSAIDDKIIYYDGDTYEKGYYYINAAKITSNIADMDDYISILRGWNENNFIKLNTDAPIQTYDAVSQNAPSKNTDRNAIAVQGQCYYVDFEWDGVDGPVLAMYHGLSNSAWWRGDLSSESNKNVWVVMEVK